MNIYQILILKKEQNLFLIKIKIKKYNNYAIISALFLSFHMQKLTRKKL